MSRRYKLTDLLCAFDLDSFTHNEIKFLVKCLFRLGNKFGYVSAHGVLLAENAENLLDANESYFSEFNVVGCEYHYAKFTVRQTTGLDDSVYAKELTVDEDFLERTGIRPLITMPVIADRDGGLHVLESFTLILPSITVSPQ